MKNKIKCKKCGVLVSKFAINRHEKQCNGDSSKFRGDQRQKIIIQEKWLQNDGKYCCPFCEKKFSKKGIATHIFRKHTDKGKSLKSNFTEYNKNNERPWNYGLTKENSEKIFIISEKLTGVKRNFNYTQEWCEEFSKKLKESNKVGGIRQGAGRGKSGWYKGYWCDST